MKTIAILLTLFFLTSQLFAEFIFLKDGKIIEGEIVKESDKEISLKEKESGKAVQIPRKNIMRVSYGELDKEKVYVYKNDGSIYEGFQVDENKFAYTFRKDLYKPAEIQIPKKKIKTISKERVTKAGPKLSGAVLRSSLFPGWGQYYSQNKTTAYIWWGSTAAVIGGSTFLFLNKQSTWDDYMAKKSGSKSDFTKSFNKAQSAAHLFDAAMFSLASLWLFNVADVWLFSGPKNTGGVKLKTGQNDSRVKYGLNIASKQVYFNRQEYERTFTSSVGYIF